MRKSPPEQLLAKQCATQSQDAQKQDERMSPDQQDDTPDQDNSVLFHKSCLVGPSKYASDCMHCWLFILLKCETPPDIETLQGAP